MARKVLLTLAAVTIATGSIIAPASAATIKSGQSCSPVNAKKTIKYQGDSYVYKCVKNPQYKKTRLTWTLQECLTAIADYKAAKKTVDAAKAAGSKPSDIDTQLMEMAKDLRDMSCGPGI